MLSSVVVAEITQSIREIPSCVLLTKADHMPKRCVVNCDNILTVPVERLSNRVTSLSGEKMRLVDSALRFVLSLA